MAVSNEIARIEARYSVCRLASLGCRTTCRDIVRLISGPSNDGRLSRKSRHATIRISSPSEYQRTLLAYRNHSDPKEDMIFEKLKARDPVAAERIGDLESEHQHERIRLQRVADVIRLILTDHDVLGETFKHIIGDFIEQEREHMKMEECLVFSAAAHALQSEDWAEIDARWSEAKDSLFNVAIEERCQSLRERILRWQREKSELENHAFIHK